MRKRGLCAISGCPGGTGSVYRGRSEFGMDITLVCLPESGASKGSRSYLFVYRTACGFVLGCSAGDLSLSVTRNTRAYGTLRAEVCGKRRKSSRVTYPVARKVGYVPDSPYIRGRECDLLTHCFMAWMAEPGGCD